MSDYEFGVGEYMTRCGFKAVVTSSEFPLYGCPLFGWVVKPDGFVETASWYKDGRHLNNTRRGLNLILPKPWSAENGTLCYEVRYKGEHIFSINDALRPITEIIDILNAQDGSHD